MPIPRLSIRARLTAVFTAVVVAVTALVVPVAQHSLEDAVGAVESRALHSHYTSLLASADMTALSALRLSALVAELPATQDLFAARDRDALLAFFGPAHDRLARDLGIRQFQFHTPPATSFLRLHRQDAFGDDLGAFRHTVVRANRDAVQAVGLERGVAGFGVRAVVPVLSQGRPVGTVEFGLDFGGDFAQRFADRFGVEVALHLPNEAGFTILGRSAEGTLTSPGDLARALAGAPVVTRGATHGHPSAAIAGVVRDFSGTPVAVAEIVMDASAYTAILRQGEQAILLMAALLIVAGGVASWLLAGSLVRPLSSLTEAMNRLARGDVAAEAAGAGRGDEIGDMARAFAVFRTQAIANRTLGRMQQEMAAIVAGSHDAIYGIDAEGRITSWNAGAEAVYGYTAEEVLGRPFDILVPEDAQAESRVRMASVMRGQDVRNVEVTRRRKTGEEIILSLAASPIEDEQGRRGVAVIGRDVTEQRRARDALERSRARLNEAERIGGLGHWEWQVDSGRLLWSDQVFRIFGQEPTADGETTYDAFLAAVVPADRPRLEEAVADALEGADYVVEHRILRPDGAVRHLRERGEVFRDAEGRPLRMLGTVVDITDHVAQAQALRQANHALRTLSAGNEVLVHAVDEDQLLADMCRTVVGIGGYSGAWVGYRRDGELECVAVTGEPGGVAAPPTLAWAAADAGHPAARAVKSGQPCLMAPGEAAPEAEAVLALPLRDGDRVFGALTIHGRDGRPFHDEERRLLTELGGDLAYGIINQRTRMAQTDSLRRLESSMEQTIQAVAATLESRDPYTAGHQQRVAHLAEAIARRLGLSEEEVKGIHMAGVIHDIGKIYIPAEILNRPGKLRPEEFALIRTHCAVGAEIIGGVDFPWPVRDILLQHHERLDGSGYPFGLEGDAILRGARILAVADVVEAIASHRPYRPALGLGPAVEEIRAGAGSRYDPAVVEACVAVVEEEGLVVG